MDLPEQGFMLTPWLLESSLNLISAEAGTGKTFFAMEVAAACVDGRTAMEGRWESPQRFNVLILDGEMLPTELRKRARLLDLSGRCKAHLQSLVREGAPAEVTQLGRQGHQGLAPELRSRAQDQPCGHRQHLLVVHRAGLQLGQRVAAHERVAIEAEGCRCRGPHHPTTRTRRASSWERLRGCSTSTPT